MLAGLGTICVKKQLKYKVLETTTSYTYHTAFKTVPLTVKNCLLSNKGVKSENQLAKPKYQNCEQSFTSL